VSLVAPIVAGAAAGGGLALVIAQLLPTPPPELRSAVARLNAPLKEATQLLNDPRETAATGEGSALIPESLISWLSGSGLVRATPEDLAILGKTPEQHTTQKIGMGILGFLLAPFMAALGLVANIHLPLAVPAGLSVIFGTLCFFGPDLEVSGKAKKARNDFDKILHGYLVNVALERRANLGIVQALEEAASVGDSWVLHRIRNTLLAAQMSNVTPWQALEELGTVLGVMHLVEAAQTMRSASEEGTAVFQRLIAQADSLGDAVLAEERVIANARSERMIVPVAVMGILVLTVLTYPAVAQISGVR
jgi:hypothetical protein